MCDLPERQWIALTAFGMGRQLGDTENCGRFLISAGIGVWSPAARSAPALLV
jgi:hypothetical protein